MDAQTCHNYNTRSPYLGQLSSYRVEIYSITCIMEQSSAAIHLFELLQPHNSYIDVYSSCRPTSDTIINRIFSFSLFNYMPIFAIYFCYPLSSSKFVLSYTVQSSVAHSIDKSPSIISITQRWNAKSPCVVTPHYPRLSPQHHKQPGS